MSGKSLYDVYDTIKKDVRDAMKKHGFSGSVSRGRGVSAVYITISKGCEAFNRGHIQINPYFFEEDDELTEEAKAAIRDILAAANRENWDESDSQRDYFAKGWSTHIEIGRWDKPYVSVC